MNGVRCADRALFQKCMKGANEIFANLSIQQKKVIDSLKEFQDSLGKNIESAVGVLESMSKALDSAQENFSEQCSRLDILLEKVEAAQEEKVF